MSPSVPTSRVRCSEPTTPMSTRGWNPGRLASAARSPISAPRKDGKPTRSTSRSSTGSGICGSRRCRRRRANNASRNRSNRSRRTAPCTARSALFDRPQLAPAARVDFSVADEAAMPFGEAARSSHRPVRSSDMKTILISGAGIAGPTLAFWLRAAGFVPTLIERAPDIRTGGYVIDFWGLGYDIADRMGLIEDINRLGYRVTEMRIVDDAGRRRAGFGTRDFRELTGGRDVTLPRGELSRLLFERIMVFVECMLGYEIAWLREETDGIWVRLRHGGERRFDLVIGADGLHSAVRQLAFGPAAQFEKDLGYMVAAFESEGYRPRDDDVYLIYGQPGRMI